jgi:hypothetical protein
LKTTLKQFYADDGTIAITAIDSSGFISGYSSHNYSARTGKIQKHFLKTSIAVDTDRQLITGFTVSKSRVHDSQNAFLLLKKCHQFRKSEYYVMDRSYDSEKMHRVVRDTLNAILIIPTRPWKNTNYIWGKYRKKMTDNFDSARYR